MVGVTQVRGITRLLGDVVTIKTPTTSTDVYGSTQFVYTSGTDYPARMQQTTGVEVTRDRDTQVSDWLLFLNPDAVISGDSRVVFNGSTFEVLGPPYVVSTPRTVGPHHIEARLRHVTG